MEVSQKDLLRVVVVPLGIVTGKNGEHMHQLVIMGNKAVYTITECVSHVHQQIPGGKSSDNMHF